VGYLEREVNGFSPDNLKVPVSGNYLMPNVSVSNFQRHRLFGKLRSGI
jgi:hypothetical protein